MLRFLRVEFPSVDAGLEGPITIPVELQIPHDAVVAEKLALVGLEGIERKRVSELSGGMKKRVGLRVEQISHTNCRLC